jgi:hypothetical protein
MNQLVNNQIELHCRYVMAVANTKIAIAPLEIIWIVRKCPEP